MYIYRTGWRLRMLIYYHVPASNELSTNEPGLYEHVSTFDLPGWCARRVVPFSPEKHVYQ